MSTDDSISRFVRPADRHLFAPTWDRYGLRLALVFGNHAPGGRCPYYASGKCRHCDIGAGEGITFHPEINRRRLTWFQQHYHKFLPNVNHLVLYNSGSVLDSREMPSNLLDEILAWAQSLPALKVLSLESREESVTADSARRVAGALGPSQTARVILGLETSDDRLRNDVLVKDMPRAAVQRAVDAIGSVAADLESDRIGLTFNILIGGPGTTSETAVDDAITTAIFAFQSGQNSKISIDLNLHPYYRSMRGQTFFPTHPRCSPQTVAQAAGAIMERSADITPQPTLFIGTEDEDHDRESVPADWDASTIREAFAEFNKTQNPSALQW